MAEPDRNAQAELRYHELGTPAARDAIIHAATGRRDWLRDGSISGAATGCSRRSNTA